MNKADQKAIQIVSVLSRDYPTLIGLEGIGLYVFLVRMGVTSLGVMKPNVLAQALQMEDDKLSILIKKLKVCGLISFKKKSEGKYSYKTLDFTPLSYPEKLHLLDQMYSEKLVSYDEKKSAEFIMNLDHKTFVPAQGLTLKTKTKKPEEAVKEIDLEAIEKRRNPNSFPALVDYYYSTLSKTFGKFCTSYNIVAEAKLLKNSMRKNNDSPEAVKKMFKYMISDAHTRGKIEFVSHVGLYTRRRNIVHHHVFSEDKANPTFEIGKVADNEAVVEVKYIKQMFEYYVNKGVKEDIIIRESLMPQFGEKSVQNFLDTRVSK